MAKITVQSTSVTVVKINEQDYISLTDMARAKSEDPTAVIGNWMRNRNTIEYLGIWESLYNPDFKPLEFEGFRKEAGLNAFTLSPQKWIEATNAMGIVSKSGRMPIKILLLSLPVGSLWNSSYISSANSSVSKNRSMPNLAGAPSGNSRK